MNLRKRTGKKRGEDFFITFGQKIPDARFTFLLPAIACLGVAGIRRLISTLGSLSVVEGESFIFQFHQNRRKRCLKKAQ